MALWCLPCENEMAFHVIESFCVKINLFIFFMLKREVQKMLSVLLNHHGPLWAKVQLPCKK
jgi:hypothetical protein